MEWVAAVRLAGSGVVLEVAVVPGASVSRFPAGFDPWRGRLEAKVRAPPEDGQANAELCRLVAEALGVPSGAVSISSGHASRRKSVRVEGLGLDEARARIERAMAG